MRFLFIFMVFVLVSCQTVTISDSAFKKHAPPHYQDTKWFFLWGIVPDVQQVNIPKVCKNKELAQAQTLDSFANKLVRIFTLGIVYPKTVKVWCK